MSQPSSASSPLLIACLCADWCGTCRSYREFFDQWQPTLEAHVWRKAWIDVEDHDDILGTLEIDNFPTLLLAKGTEVLFFGTITPHAATLARLVQTAVDGNLKIDAAPVEIHELLKHL